MGVAVRRSAVSRRPSNRQGVLRQSQETLDRSADHGARVIHCLSLWNANVHARPGWKKRRPLTAKTRHAAEEKDRLAAVSPKFNYCLLDAICLPMIGVAIDDPDTERFARELSGPWQKSAVHSYRQQLSHFEKLLGVRTSASFRCRCLDQTIEPVPAQYRRSAQPRQLEPSSYCFSCD